MYQHERTNTIIAWVMGAFSFIVYMMTTAPVVAFWDNGEFIAVGYILGVGHPPGSPVYTLLSRLFGLLPFPNVAQAINFTSVVAGAAAIFFFYLAIAKIAKRWEGEITSFADGIPTYVAGITACLFIAFSFSFWENALEAEVYAWNVLVMAVTLWLVLRWSELAGPPRPRRHLYLVFYFLALGIGIHMGSLLWAPGFLVFMIIFERSYLGSVLLAVPFAMGFFLMSKGMPWWHAPMTLWVLGLVQAVYFAYPRLWPKPERTARRGKDKGKQKEQGAPIAGWLTMVLAVLGLVVVIEGLTWTSPGSNGAALISVVVTGVALWGFDKLVARGTIARPETPARALLAALALTFLALSVHAYLLIRARLEPAINESEPKTVKAVLEVMRRAQYEPMRFFPRRTPFPNQFKIVGGYHAQQFTSSGNILAILAPYLLSLWGLITHARKDKRTFIMMLIGWLMASLGLLMYLNVSDHEVRSREYFWVPSYVGLAIWMGIGSGAIVQWAKDLGKAWRNILVVAVIAFALLPLLSNYRISDRSNNYIAHNYGMNILSYLEEDAILITNGDNDTFPLWYLQQVEGVRLDVDIVNLSLAQINWHLKQIKQEGVPLSFTYEQIEQMHPYWTRDPETNELQLVTLKDIAIHDIIRTNNWERPIYFAVTVDDFMGYYDNLKLEGMVFRLTQETGRHMVDVERTYENVFENYDYTSIVDVEDNWRVVHEVYKSGPTARLITNYAAGFSRLGFVAMQDPEQTDEAIRLYTLALKFAPDYGPALNGLVAIYAARLIQPHMALPFAERLVESQPELVEGWVRYGGVHLMIAEGYQRQNQVEEARPHFEEAVDAYEYVLSRDPERIDVYAALMTAYQHLGMADRVNNLMEMWQMYGPGAAGESGEAPPDQ